MPLILPKPVVIGEQKLKPLVYADAGIGKTSLAATAAKHPDMSPVLILNLEGGLLSVAGIDGLAEVPISNSAELEEAYWALKQKKPGFDRYKTVVIDSGTVLANRVLVEWVDRNQQRATRRGRGDADRTLDDIQLEDYGKMTAQIRRLLAWFYDLPYHVICTALAKTVYPPTDPNSKVDSRLLQPAEIRPDFTDKLGGQIMGIFDHVWYMYTDGEGSRYMLTQPSGIYRAKTRGRYFSAAIGNPVANPDLSVLYSTLLETEGRGFSESVEGSESGEEGEA